jgi:hypothetical protein
MDTSTIDPNVMKGIIVFSVVLVAALIGRWALNVREDMEDRREAKAAKQSKDA